MPDIQKYEITLTERPEASDAAPFVAGKLDADASLRENARRRTGGIKLDRWWSVIAGLSLVTAFVLYTFYLTIPAAVALGVLAAFLGFVAYKMLSRRAVLRKTDPEISPGRCMDAFIRMALEMPAGARDISRLFNAEQVGEFSAELSARLARFAGEAQLRTMADVTAMEKLDDACARIPLKAVLTYPGAEVTIGYFATFAFSANGDCMLCDQRPDIGDIRII